MMRFIRKLNLALLLGHPIVVIGRNKELRHEGVWESGERVP